MKQLQKYRKLKLNYTALFALTFVCIGSYFILFSNASSPAGDINNDGQINIIDLSLLLSSYGSNRPACVTNLAYTCDLNSDSAVNVFDLSVLLSNYGQSVQTGNLKIGVIDVGADYWKDPSEVSTFYNTGERYDRCSVSSGGDIGGSNTCMHAATSHGLTTLPVYDVNLQAMDITTPASNVSSIAQAMRPLGYPVLEFGNENYCQGCNGWTREQPQQYADQYDAAHKAIAGMGIKLLAQAYGKYQNTAGVWSDNSNTAGWIHDFIAEISQINGVSQSTAAAEVDGWTVHPYGPMTTSIGGDDGGWPMVGILHNIAVANGSNASWWITEVGQSLTNVSQQQQASDMTQYLDDLVQADPSVPNTPYSFVEWFTWYRNVDDSTNQYGLVNTSGNTITSIRPSLTALGDWITTHSAKIKHGGW